MVASTVCRAGGVLAVRKVVRIMLLFCGVIAALILIICFLAGMAVYFAEDISAYLQAKTDEIKAMTEILRKEKEDA